MYWRYRVVYSNLLEKEHRLIKIIQIHLEKETLYMIHIPLDIAKAVYDRGNQITNIHTIKTSQGPRKIDKWGGGGTYSYICVVNH